MLTKIKKEFTGYKDLSRRNAAKTQGEKMKEIQFKTCLYSGILVFFISGKSRNPVKTKSR
jgi:hypothetical protein